MSSLQIIEGSSKPYCEISLVNGQLNVVDPNFPDQKVAVNVCGQTIGGPIKRGEYRELSDTHYQTVVKPIVYIKHIRDSEEDLLEVSVRHLSCFENRVWYISRNEFNRELSAAAA